MATRSPSIKALCERLSVEREIAVLIRRIIKAEVDPCEVVPGVQKWVDSLYNPPSNVELKMHAIDSLLENCGVERQYYKDGRLAFIYSNTGDSYVPTIVRKAMGGWSIDSWGGIIERNMSKF